MAATDAPTLLVYALVQVAAEAVYPDGYSGAIDPALLVAGNGRASVFTDLQAREFASKWEIVDHKANTATGFSGTLFRAIKDDPVLGIVKDELVLSFRSTVGIDFPIISAICEFGSPSSLQ